MFDGLRLPNLQILIAAGVLAACVMLRIADPAPIAQLRAATFDSYLRAAPRVADPSFPVRIVAIDEEALAAVGQWPWPRARLAELVAKLAAAGARTITFDIMMPEPDRLSPSELARAYGDDASLQPLLSEIAKRPSNDELLGRAIAAAPVVLGVVGDGRGESEIATARASLAFAGDDPKQFVHAFPSGVANLPVLTNGAHGVGAVNWLPSRDQIVRRAPLVLSVGSQLYPSLALEALRVGSGQSTIFIKSSGGSGVSAFGQRTGIEHIRVGKMIAPTDGRGEMQLKFSATDPRRTMSAARILSGAFDPADISGRHIFFGATAAGLLDLRATPLDASTPGVEIHAQALEQLLSGDHLVRPAYAAGAEIAFLIFAGAIVTWLMGRSGATLAALVAAVAIFVVMAISWLAYSRGGLLFDAVYPSAALILLYLTTSLATYVRSEAERARVRSAFSHYVAPSLVDELVRNRETLKLGGEDRVVTLLFADVRGFSRLSEGLTPEQLIQFVNRLFTPLSDTILGHLGTIDKFMGDAVMAFWNAPAADCDHARNACRAALAMLDELEKLNGDLEVEARARGDDALPVRIGIGLNTGACVVGNVGSPQRFDYSVLGDVVNVASRFEEATKTFGVDIILGESTAAAAPDFAHLEIGMATPRGKDRSERIFALFGDEHFAATAEFASLKAAHEALLAARLSNNVEIFEAALARCHAAAPERAQRLYQNFAARGGERAAGDR